MNTPNQTEKNPAAVALGRLTRGKKKTLSPAERQRRSEAMKAMRARMIAEQAQQAEQAKS